MANSIVEVNCPRCGHKWTEDVEELKKRKEIIYHQDKPQPGEKRYSVTCPNCGTVRIITVMEQTK